ncbi:hypothetical protein DY000_02034524 [Brassica cretica]|uniref:Transmembrane protein n=1 Tax=Brassica cretica TaxID=69181 RepID=A0ABQ7DFJ9_BRACR|nr:hypothetical protein DY000_02034524 [Brassica cretica]
MIGQIFPRRDGAMAGSYSAEAGSRKACQRETSKEKEFPLEKKEETERFFSVCRRSPSVVGRAPHRRYVREALLLLFILVYFLLGSVELGEGIFLRPARASPVLSEAVRACLVVARPFCSINADFSPGDGGFLSSIDVGSSWGVEVFFSSTDATLASGKGRLP